MWFAARVFMNLDVTGEYIMDAFVFCLNSFVLLQSFKTTNLVSIMQRVKSTIVVIFGSLERNKK